MSLANSSLLDGESCVHHVQKFEVKAVWTTEMKLKQNSYTAVLFQPKQNARAVKRFSGFSQSQSVSAVCAQSQKQRIQAVIG